MISRDLIEGTRFQGGVVRASSITSIDGFVRRPTGAFGIRHADFALLLTVHGGTEASFTFVAGGRAEGFTFALFVARIGVVGVTAVLAFFTGEGRDATARVDNDGLSLGGGRADPKIDVVGAVALVEGRELLVGESTEGRAYVLMNFCVATVITVV